jgi:hypothetical protein
MEQGNYRSEDQEGVVDNHFPHGSDGNIGSLSVAPCFGPLYINGYDITDPASPFGSFKQSGRGREIGRKVLDSYTEVKSVWVNRS